jgi:peptide/nickel transport system substrate-binding protein
MVMRPVPETSRMLSRRTLLASAAATPLLSYDALADTPKDVIVMGMQIDDLISLDPGEAFEFTGTEINGNVYQKLVIPDPTNPNVIKGELAESWATSDDGLTTTFTLKTGMKFASGRPVTAEDAAFSLVRAVKLNKAPAFIVNQFGFTKDNVEERVRATGPNTLVLTVGEKVAPTFLLYCLSANVGSVVDKATVMGHVENSDFGNGWMKTNSAGSGSWAVRSWKASENVILEPNPNAAVQPKLKRVILRHIPDPSSQLLQLQKGDIDVARNLLSDQIKPLQTNAAYKVSAAARSYIMYMAMNQAVPALAKPQVRQAIKWAVDYDAIQTNITPTNWQVQQSFLPQGFPGALNDRPFRKDTAKARALLVEAGYPNGFELTMDHASTQPIADIAQAIQADLAAIGIKLTLLSGESRQVITKTRARQHQMAIVSWGSDYFDPHSNAETFNVNIDNTDAARSKTLAWRSSWQDKELSDLALANVRELDAKKRIAVYETMQRMHHERSPFVMLLQSTEMAVMRKELAGFDVAPLYDRTVYTKAAKAAKA